MSVIEPFVWSLLPCPTIRQVALESAGGLLWCVLAATNSTDAVGDAGVVCLLTAMASVFALRRRRALETARQRHSRAAMDQR
jgi:hypothetical protein